MKGVIHMGLIKAGIGALGGTLADQWKEFFYCDALPNDVLMRKGEKRVSGRSSNTRGNDNVISNGSGIAVADGQCMIIVEQGKIVEVCAEPGEFTYDASTEPSVFSGNLGDSILETFRTIGKRFAYGGDTGKDQRVYYFNTKEIIGNKFGTPNPIMFEVVNKRIGISRTVQVRCNGVYTYVISDPLLFYTRLCGNVEREFTRDQIDEQLKSEFIDALQPALGALAEQELRPAVKRAMAASIEEKGVIDVQSVAEEVFRSDPEREAMIEQVSRQLAEESVEPVIPVENKRVVAQLQKVKIRTDNGISISLPRSLADDEGSFAVINNPDGTISIVINHVQELRTE